MHLIGKGVSKRTFGMAAKIPRESPSDNEFAKGTKVFCSLMTVSSHG